jgi:V/A-type H+-transporting ATPase subunit E
MQNKLQELTDKIYLEGVARGNKEAETIIAEATTESEKIRKEAEKKAEEIIAKARKEADEIKKNTLSELRISFRHSLNSLKQDIERLISDKIVDYPVSKVFSDSSFVARLIETTAEKMFAGNNEPEVDINVPEEMMDEIEKYIRKETTKALSSGIVLHPSGSMEKGFEIIPHGKGYKIRITEAEFTSYIKGFLRSKLVDLLFEQDK